MTDWKICENSCCVLVKEGVGLGQGILLCHSQHKQKTYWLLTCHHLITSKAASQGFYVHIFNGKSGKCFKLDKNSVGRFYSCCGENGILGEAEHFYKPRPLRPSLFPLPHSPFKNGIFGEAEPFYKPRPLVPPPVPRCPFDLDFTLIEVKGAHVEEILSCIKVIDLNLCIKASRSFVSGSICSLLRNQYAEECYFYQRNKECFSQVKYKEHYLQLSWPVPQSKKVSILRDWGSKMSHFNVTEDDESDICGRGSSGAAIYVIHKSGMPLLTGMHIGRETKKHRDIKSSMNINFLWVIMLLMVNSSYSSHLLWAIFLQYEKEESKTKNESLLSKVADVIWNQLHQLQEREQLNDDEIKMFGKIEHFFSCRKHRYKELSEIEKSLNDQEIATTPTEDIYIQATEEKHSQVTDTGFYSDWKNPDDDSAGNVPEERFSNAELVTGIFNCLHFTLIYDNIC